MKNQRIPCDKPRTTRLAKEQQRNESSYIIPTHILLNHKPTLPFSFLLIVLTSVVGHVARNVLDRSTKQRACQKQFHFSWSPCNKSCIWQLGEAPSTSEAIPSGKRNWQLVKAGESYTSILDSSASTLRTLVFSGSWKEFITSRNVLSKAIRQARPSGGILALRKKSRFRIDSP